MPGRTTPYGINSNQLAQGVDVFPTVVAAALGHPLPPCPKDSSKVATCTQGVSLLPLTYSPHSPVNVAAFSVHPSYWKPTSEHASDESALSERFDRLDPNPNPNPNPNLTLTLTLTRRLVRRGGGEVDAVEHAHEGRLDEDGHALLRGDVGRCGEI